jgi:hypothetical protein
MGPHTHRFDGRWPFQEPDNTAVFCCDHVFERSRPILYVRHDHDGDWQFLCGDTHIGGPRVLCFGCVIELDASLWPLADLPIGWGAERAQPEAEWVRQASPEPEEESEDDA